MLTEPKNDHLTSGTNLGIHLIDYASTVIIIE